MPDTAQDRKPGTASGHAGTRAARVPGRPPEKAPPGPSTEDLRRISSQVIDQRHQQIDPAGQHRRDPNRRAATSMKQSGGKVAPDALLGEPAAGDDPAEPG